MSEQGRRAVLLFTLLLLIETGAWAMPPPREGGELPEAYLERVEDDPRAFTFSRALLGQVQRIRSNRARAAAGALAAEDIETAGGIAVEGERSIPVLPVKFRNTAQDPYDVAGLQRQLFDPSAPGTMTAYYREVSYGLLDVTGTVRPWADLRRDDTFYEGADFRGANGVMKPCLGMCRGAGTGDLLREALEANDAALDFGQFDNDGPDRVPNSGDDNGFVDFVAFVHPEAGGECETAASLRNIWSHRWVYSAWKGAAFVTGDRKHGGGFIRVDDYVITPAVACDQRTMIQIGVFAHEFGHAFGLPDLYDTDRDNGESEGVGHWCLMGAGAWGGDGKHPERPAHPSAWAKAFLGWIFPHTVRVGEDFRPAEIPAIETARLAFKIPISPSQYYLVENRQRQGFDEHLAGSGLLIWKINETAVTAGLAGNTVNADETNKGVGLEQADGLDELDGVGDRGDEGDVFAGSTRNTRFQNSSRPRSLGRTAVCDVGAAGPIMTAHLLVGTGTCPDAPQAAPAAAAPTTVEAQPAESPSIRDVAATPDRYIDQSVRLTGTLVNLGTNFFTDRRIVLRDAAGNTIEVEPWLPLESPPGKQGGPPTLASYLGKKVEILGKLERRTVDGETLVLEVKAAEVVPPS